MFHDHIVYSLQVHDQVLEYLKLRLFAVQQQKFAPDFFFYFRFFAQEELEMLDFEVKVFGEALFSVAVVAQHFVVAHVLDFVGLH